MAIGSHHMYFAFRICFQLHKLYESDTGTVLVVIITAFTLVTVCVSIISVEYAFILEC